MRKTLAFTTFSIAVAVLTLNPRATHDRQRSEAAQATISPPEARPIVANPFLEHALPVEERHWLHGSVVTRLLAGAYVYLLMRQPSGAETWLVSLAATTPEQNQVRALVLGRSGRFHSRRLDRDFSPLLFAAVRGAEP
jgi:hypothetical protein